MKAMTKIRHLQRYAKQHAHHLELTGFTLLIISCLLVRVHNFDTLPPLHEDEARVAMSALRLVDDKRPVLSNLENHEPPVSAYLVMPFLLLFGINLVGLRILAVILGLATICLVFMFSKRYFGAKVAFVASILFSSSFLSLTYSRLYMEYSLMPFFSISSVYAFFLFLEKREKKYLFLLAFLLGLAINSKLIAIQYTVAFAISVIIFYRKDLRILSRKDILKVSVLFLIPFIPFAMSVVIDNFGLPLELIKLLIGLERVDYVQNSAIISNVLTKLYQATLQFGPLLLPAVFYCMFLAGKKARFVSTLFILTLVGLAFSLVMLRLTHQTIVLPLAYILITIFIFLLGERLICKPVTKTLFFVFVLAGATYIHVTNVHDYLGTIGPPEVSVPFLMERLSTSLPHGTVIATPTLYLGYRMQFLTQNKLKVHAFDGFMEHPVRKEINNFKPVLQQFLSDGVRHYVFVDEDFQKDLVDTFHGYFLSELSARNISYSKVRAYDYANGITIYTLNLEE